jgi:hypothetical protein
MFRRLFLLIALVAMLLLVACDAQDELEEVQPTLEAAATDLAPTLEAAATEVVAQVTEAAPTVEAVVTEVVEEATEAAEEPTEEPEPTEAPATEEAMAGDPFAGIGDCAPAEEGDLAGVDPRGQTITWWHNHSGSREENMIPLL